MTRFLLVLFVLIGATRGIQAQNLVDLEGLKPPEEFDNVHVEPISDGVQATSFVIWIKEGVKAHYHREHAEHIYILAGTGNMTLDNEVFGVKAGDFVRIPPESVHAVTVTSDIPLKVLSVQTPQFLGQDRHWVDQ
ncbi:MAG TPA: cupin domain-containing protein [Cytophagales bacterium]|nr:cupin domain-containing protein [Cytophagales bacterium]HAA17851.1 cupin domain-containing protein [Cytophagales bacterium]HAP58228.1 cupin domain-containing protein [Cytophagales bacterium]